jgi:hypothetical protein
LWNRRTCNMQIWVQGCWMVFRILGKYKTKEVFWSLWQELTYRWTSTKLEYYNLSETLKFFDGQVSSKFK